MTNTEDSTCLLYDIIYHIVCVLSKVRCVTILFSGV